MNKSNFIKMANDDDIERRRLEFDEYIQVIDLLLSNENYMKWYLDCYYETQNIIDVIKVLILNMKNVKHNIVLERYSNISYKRIYVCFHTNKLIDLRNLLNRTNKINYLLN